jgi:hypothetical protein
MRAIIASLLVFSLAACNKDLDGDGFKADEDCNDNNDAVNSGATEICDGIDNDCNGQTDEGLQTIFYLDADGDQYGDPETSTAACTAPDDYVENDEDCNDDSPEYRPGAAEGDCEDPNDYNCDGSVGFEDLDEDGWAACNDCADDDPEINPASEEVCDEVDNNCNGVVDLDAPNPPTWYLDYDGDGYGDATVKTEVCLVPERFVAQAGDCDDSSDQALPGGTEVCDGLDNDCDGTVDGADAAGAEEYYTDADGDGYGVSSTLELRCEPDTNQTSEDGDCADDDELVNPGATEVCNDGVDNDCDGTSEGCEIDTEALANVVIHGENATDYAGRDVQGVGDVNGDGVDDLLIGADGFDASASNNEGAGYVILGPFTNGTDDTVDALAHVRLDGTSSDGSAGARVHGVGDMDGDGLDDLLIAATTATDRAVRSGTVHLILGSTVTAASAGSTVSLDDSDYQWHGNDGYDWAGSGLAALGDWNGDGVADFAIGATGDETGGTGSGTTYLILGTGSVPSDGSASVDAAAAVRVSGNAGWYTGADIDGVGDLDGDGFDDLAIGAIQANANGVLAGGAFVVAGGQTGDIAIDDVDLTLNGASAGDRAGAAVKGAGDIDGDGLPDLLVGISRDNTGAADAGAIALVYGRADLSTIDGSDVQTIADAMVVGSSSGLGIGDVFESDFDWDGDGENDLLIGAPRDGLDGEGAAYLMLGPISGTQSLATDTYASFVGDGAGDGVGSAVSVPGDLFGTGDAVLAIGAWEDDANGTDAGGVYLINEIGL